MSEPQRRFRVVLRAIPDETPAIIRLRVALKFLLRRFRLRCEQVEEIEPEEESAREP